MAQYFHKRATTTHAIRAEIQRPTEGQVGGMKVSEAKRLRDWGRECPPELL